MTACCRSGAVRVLRAIIKAAGHGNAPAQAPFDEPVEVVFERLKATLERARCYTDAQAGFLAGARYWFLGRSAEQTSAPNTTTAAALGAGRGEVANDEEPETSQTSIRLSSLLSRVPAKVKPGAWFEIYRGEGKAKRRLKLSAVLEVNSIRVNQANQDVVFRV
jgi:hypothetical protein